MLAKYNLGTNYKQSTKTNYVKVAYNNGWEYSPGPKEIDVQTWGGDTKTLLNNYVSYLQTELGDTTVSGDLITLTELEPLGCTIQSDYSGGNCVDSTYKEWLLNDQFWRTRLASPEDSRGVYSVSTEGYAVYDANSGVRPVITISKDTLKNLG